METARKPQMTKKLKFSLLQNISTQTATLSGLYESSDTMEKERILKIAACVKFLLSTLDD